MQNRLQPQLSVIQPHSGRPACLHRREKVPVVLEAVIAVLRTSMVWSSLRGNQLNFLSPDGVLGSLRMGRCPPTGVIDQHHFSEILPFKTSHNMTTATTPSKKDQDWADASDDGEEESVPTVKVDTDSLDLTSLSLGDKDKPAQTSGKSLADRISSGDATTDGQEPERTTDKITTASPSTEETDKEAKEQETNLIKSRYEVAVKLQDMQADPNSPLYSVKSFEELGLYDQSCIRS
jgi:hypothetical protein